MKNNKITVQLTYIEQNRFDIDGKVYRNIKCSDGIQLYKFPIPVDYDLQDALKPFMPVNVTLVLFSTKEVPTFKFDSISIVK